MTYECFKVSIENQIAHIVLNRPEKRNAMNRAFWDELPEIIDDIDSNARARVIVISSTGPHFTSGLDIAAFMGTPSSTEKNAEEQHQAKMQSAANFYNQVQKMQNTFSCLDNCRMPILAAIQGGCIGGGVDLSTACDMRYTTADAYFTIFEINIGMTADVGTFPRLVKLIPEGKVKELAYTGRRMYAEEAMSTGLVNAIFPDQESMLAGVMEIAKTIASKAPMAVYGSKRIINYSRDHSTSDGLDYIAIWNASMLLPEEMREAMSAAAEKRSANFVDLPPTSNKLSL